MLITTQWLQTNATSNINRAYKRLPDGLSRTAMFCAAMQLGDRHSHKTLPPDSTSKAAPLFRKPVLLRDSQYFLCRFPRSTKAFCCCGSHPTGISVHMHRGCPAALSTRPSVPCTTHHKSSYHSEKQLSSLEYSFCFIMQVTYYTFQLNLCPSTIPRGTKTA